MHDPLTVAWEIKSPFKNERGYRSPIITIWHRDPEKGPGGDDSCGWFNRAHHGDPKVLDKIEKRFSEDWDRTWTYDPAEDGGNDDEDRAGKRTYARGLFFPNGMPRYSIPGIVLNLFFMAANEHFQSNGITMWKKSKRFLKDNLLDILLFAENPVDSLHDSLVLTFRSGDEPPTKERISNMAAIIYGWVLRADQIWWKHPRWHIHHWELQIHPIQEFKRWAFSRCCKCGKGFSYGSSVCSGSWNSVGPRWFKSEENIYHSDCGNVSVSSGDSKTLCQTP